MASKNAVSIIGSLGRDPEFKDNGNTQSARLAVATSEKWKDKATGEWKENTEWHSVVVFGPQAIYASKYLSKGSLVSVDGSLKTSKYVDTSGVERYTTQIMGRDLQGLDKKPSTQSPQEPKQSYNQHQNNADDDIPF